MPVHISEVHPKEILTVDDTLTVFEAMRIWVKKEWSIEGEPTDSQVLSYLGGYRILGRINGQMIKDIYEEHYSLPVKEIAMYKKDSQDGYIHLAHRYRGG